jgi:hypothetical protein
VKNMSRIEELARRIAQSDKYSALTNQTREELVAELVKGIEARIGKPHLPVPGQSLAVAADTPKTAALFFDRVWMPPIVKDDIPDSVRFWAASDEELSTMVLAMFGKHDEQLGAAIRSDPLTQGFLRSFRSLTAPRAFSEAVGRKLNRPVVPVYGSAEVYTKEYAPGSHEVLVAAITDLKLVDEASLAWKQVQEFREDAEAIAKLRRFRRWGDAEFARKDVGYIRDTIALRLDDYEWAIKKHGLATAVGTATDVLDPKFLAGVASVAGGIALGGAALWAAVAAGGALIGKTALSLTTRRLELHDRVRSSEVAVIHELKAMGRDE